MGTTTTMTRGRERKGEVSRHPFESLSESDTQTIMMQLDGIGLSTRETRELRRALRTGRQASKAVLKMIEKQKPGIHRAIRNAQDPKIG